MDENRKVYTYWYKSPSFSWTQGSVFSDGIAIKRIKEIWLYPPTNCPVCFCFPKTPKQPD